MNKNLKFVTAGILGSFLLVCCSGGSSSPTAATESYLRALKKGDAEKAVSYAPPSLLAEPGAKEKLLGLMKGYLAETPVDSYEILELTADGEKARAKVNLLNKGEKSSETINLIREEGRWYVDFFAT